MHHTGKGCLLLPVVFNLSISDSWNCDLSLIGIYRILKAQTRKYKLHSNVSLLSVAQRCPPNFTGADIYALCADAWFHAAKRSVSVSALLLCTLVFSYLCSVKLTCGIFWLKHLKLIRQEITMSALKRSLLRLMIL